MLYLHGLSDYFHQTELAEFHAARGDHFYALDLRKYGRSLRPHQTPCRMSDVADYYPELDAAVEFIIAEGHDRLVINAHSTGGLIALLWLHDRRARTGNVSPVRAVVLNSPFLDVPATWAIRALAPRPLAVLAKNRPMMVLPSAGPSYYQLSTHRSERGDWDFVPEWKPVTGGTVRVEWLAAAQRAIATAHAGLGLDVPDPGAVLGAERSGPGNGPRSCSAGMPCWTPMPSPAGRRGWAATSPASASTAACTICCCPNRRCGNGFSPRSRAGPTPTRASSEPARAGTVS